MGHISQGYECCPFRKVGMRGSPETAVLVAKRLLQRLIQGTLPLVLAPNGRRPRFYSRGYTMLCPFVLLPQALCSKRVDEEQQVSP